MILSTFSLSCESVPNTTTSSRCAVTFITGKIQLSNSMIFPHGVLHQSWKPPCHFFWDMQGIEIIE